MKQKTQQGITMPKTNDENIIETYTQELLEFLYPVGQSNKRLPLTRCLFYGIVETLSVFEKPEKQNFKTVIDFLDGLLLILQNTNITQEERVTLLLGRFSKIKEQSCIECDVVWEQYAINAFCYYGKLDVQKYTVACLMFDLMPFINVSFNEMYTAKKAGRSIDRVRDFQREQASYKNEQPFMRIFATQMIADCLFGKNDIFQKSIFIVATHIAEYFETTCNGLQYALQFDVDTIKMVLDQMITKNMVGCSAFFDTNTDFVKLLQYYKHICETTEIDNIAVQVLERILFYDCNVWDIVQPLSKRELQQYLNDFQKLLEEFEDVARAAGSDDFFI